MVLVGEDAFLKRQKRTAGVDKVDTRQPVLQRHLLGADVRVVSILHGHNELGGRAQVEELVSLVRKVSPQAHVHVDLVQSYGKIAFDLDDAGFEFRQEDGFDPNNVEVDLETEDLIAQGSKRREDMARAATVFTHPGMVLARTDKKGSTAP